MDADWRDKLVPLGVSLPLNYRIKASPNFDLGGVCEWLKQLDCKSGPFGVRRFKSGLHHKGKFYRSLVEWSKTPHGEWGVARFPEAEQKQSGCSREQKDCCHLIGSNPVRPTIKLGTVAQLVRAFA